MNRHTHNQTCQSSRMHTPSHNCLQLQTVWPLMHTALALAAGRCFGSIGFGSMQLLWQHWVWQHAVALAALALAACRCFGIGFGSMQVLTRACRACLRSRIWQRCCSTTSELAVRAASSSITLSLSSLTSSFRARVGLPSTKAPVAPLHTQPIRKSKKGGKRLCLLGSIQWEAKYYSGLPSPQP